MPRASLLLPALLIALGACADMPTASTPASNAGARFSSGSSGSSGTVQQLELRDDCDSVSFNAAIGAGACARRGSVTFDNFIAELTKKRIVGAWKNNPDAFGGKAGTSIEVTNIGGETHTFTRVAAFGGGIVPLLNTLSGNTTVAPGCANLDPATIVPAGGHMHGTPLPQGTYLFQCCIHPWMRTTVTIKAN